MTMNEQNKQIAEHSTFSGRGSLEQIVTELRRQVDARVDFVADVRDLELVPDAKDSLAQLRLRPRTESAREFLPRDGLLVGENAIFQVADKIPPGVPPGFMRDALRISPARTADYLTGMMHDTPHRRLVRCLDGRVRAFLSDTYRVIDNMTVASKALEAAMHVGARVLEANLTETHLRLKLIAPEIWQTIETVRTAGDGKSWFAGGLGDQKYLSAVHARAQGGLPDLGGQGGAGTVWPIVTLLNSETGHGALDLRGGILQAICFNLATVESVVRRMHLGERMETGDIWSGKTVELETQTIFSKVDDALGTFLCAEKFKALVDRARAAQGVPVHRPIAACQALISASNALKDTDLDVLVAHFSAAPGTGTLWALGQAVARLAQERDADEADDIEALAGQVLIGKHNTAVRRAMAEAV